jgi:cytochrome c oxidase subunit IV
MAFLYRLIMLLLVIGVVHAVWTESKTSRRLAYALVLPPLLLRLLLLR